MVHTHKKQRNTKKHKHQDTVFPLKILCAMCLVSINFDAENRNILQFYAMSKIPLNKQKPLNNKQKYNKNVVIAIALVIRIFIECEQ